jgi:putative transposase
VGVDLGICRFATLSSGLFYEPLNSFKRLAQKLAKEQRKLKHKQKFQTIGRSSRVALQPSMLK